MQAVLAEDSFLRLTLSDKPSETPTPWTKITARPVLVKGRRQIQFAYFSATQSVTKNYAGPELTGRLAEALAILFRQIHVQTTSGDIHVRITRKGKALLTKGKPSRPADELVGPHNRPKHYPLTADGPDEFLQAIGVMTDRGKVRPTMQGKFRQISEFLKLVGQMIPPDDTRPDGVDIVDCGCGAAYLTFAAYHYLNHVQGIEARVVGVDSNQEIIGKCCKLRDSLRWDGLDFSVSTIAEFTPEAPPDVVLSLHACDTATDEAIARAVVWQSRVILAAPCCQHELHSKLDAPLFRPVLRHGILKQRTADILTDAFRALVLRITGYRTDVVEFVSPEHTSKNLMIRAKRGVRPGDEAIVRQYVDLKSFWQVEPCIEGLLGETIGRFLIRSR